jgi:SAM-dependent methyltransferase
VNKTLPSSLLIFFNFFVIKYLPSTHLKILDMGSRKDSIFEEVNNVMYSVDGLDIANSIDSFHSKNINYMYGDISISSYLKVNYYDLVFDSHCFHCLMNLSDQKNALKNIFNSLKSGGIFSAEIMVQPSGPKVTFPNRQILETIEIENLILFAGFSIVYFTIATSNLFYTEVSGEEIECDMLRIIAKK